VGAARQHHSERHAVFIHLLRVFESGLKAIGSSGSTENLFMNHHSFNWVGKRDNLVVNVVKTNLY